MLKAATSLGEANLERGESSGAIFQIGAHLNIVYMWSNVYLSGWFWIWLDAGYP
jgi:hypothetical protein